MAVWTFLPTPIGNMAFLGVAPVQKPTINAGMASNGHNNGPISASQVPSSGSQDPLAGSQVPSSGNQEPSTGKQKVEDDIVIHLSDSEAQEFLDFDPTVKPEGYTGKVADPGVSWKRNF